MSDNKSLCDTCRYMFTCERSDVGNSWANHLVCYGYVPVKNEGGGKEERPQSKWVGNAFDEHHCKRCGHPALWEEEPDGYYEVQSRFCPNCGADMRGAE